MERSVGVSPVAVLIALLVGGALWGLVGAILAIPTVAILSVIVEEFVGRPGSRASNPRDRRKSPSSTWTSNPSAHRPAVATPSSSRSCISR